MRPRKISRALRTTFDGACAPALDVARRMRRGATPICRVEGEPKGLTMVDELRKGEADQTGAKTLWSHSDKTRQFLIPDTLQLPPGDYMLRTATEREQRVDPAALIPYEVSAEQAQAWAKAQLGEVTGRLGAGLREALFGSQGAKDDARTEGDTESSPTPGLDLLADITGTPRERFDGDYRAVGRALRDYFKDMAETAGDALSGETQREDTARRRMRGWAETLREHGIAAPEVQDPDAAPEEEQGQGPQEAERDGPETKTAKDDTERRK